MGPLIGELDGRSQSKEISHKEWDLAFSMMVGKGCIHKSQNLFTLQCGKMIHSKMKCGKFCDSSVVNTRSLIGYT